METTLSLLIIILFGVPLLMAGGIVAADVVSHPQQLTRTFKPHLILMIGFAVLLAIGWCFAAIQGKSQEYVEVIGFAFKAVAYILTGKVY